MQEFKRLEKEMFPSSHATIGTKGRQKEIPPDKFRTEFQRDIHRIIYSQSFRRLRHKTQVFYFPQNDHVSTRMDHVLFVASAARTVARCLGLNEDLAEAIGLAHDIGHAPFGHQGEKFLKEEIIHKNETLTKTMQGFSHEIYGLRVVDKIAKRDREEPGLNLTWEVRDGIISHCGEDFTTCKLIPGSKDKNLCEIKNREDAGYPATLEGCIVRLIDKVAYCGKDIEDAIAAEVIKESDVPVKINEKLGKTNGKIIGSFLESIIKESHNKDYIAMSREYGDLLHSLIDFNDSNIYHSDESERYGKQARQSVRLLFADLKEVYLKTDKFQDFEKDNKTPCVHKIFAEYVEDMRGIYEKSDPDELVVLDFIAGMTDSFVVRSFQELFIPQATV
ncbi:MAG: HD domain-containing protein [Planctomycetes bacterium]|nr:HD domain-containing protein [Planctomycetota bacterium]